MYAVNIRPDHKEKPTPFKYSKKLNHQVLLNNTPDYCE
ncbi:hypothetical protein MICA_768 [Micavibrio aeruginosavorus ARL-13]|uniref:Uncharacterized protein n=1 Tax=Micavibrio aeruginosavorus (strain ARL-13) TaxID=856793 RepID=G2KQG6_MICAA|nr:hypothetical protein MICA_768 [Micavibrio aeruginosavorus ARL-13]